jgi:hypothetical protein
VGEMYLTGGQYQTGKVELSQWERKMNYAGFLKPKNGEIIKIEIKTILNILILSF